MSRPNIARLSDRMPRGPLACGFIALWLVVAARTADAQSFYQLTNPRVYRVDPPTDNPWSHGYGFGGLGFDPGEAGAFGNVLLVWEYPPGGLAEGQRGDLVEMSIDWGSPPKGGSSNDATLVSRLFDWGWCHNIDYESDDRVLVHSRFDYTAGFPNRTPGTGIGRFTRSGENLAGFTMTVPFQTFSIGGGERMRGAFAGTRTVAGTAYDTVAEIMMNTTISGIFLVNAATGSLIDADPDAPNGSLTGNPFIGFAGDTGVTNIANPIVPGRTLIAGLDVIGDTAFVLMVLNWNATDQYLALMQVDLVQKRVIGVANVSQMFDPARGGQCSGYTQEMDVTATGDGKVRILIAECTDRTLTSLLAIDGVAVPEGSDPVDPDAIFQPTDGSGDGNGDGGTADTEPAVVWVCPGIGISLPTVVTVVGLWFTARLRRETPYT